jgi:uncharacterized protein YcgI (DUF1989 family)
MYHDRAMADLPIPLGARQDDAIRRGCARLAETPEQALRAALAEATRRGAIPRRRSDGPPAAAGPLTAVLVVEPGATGLARLGEGDALVVEQVDGDTCVDVVTWGADRRELGSPASTRAASGVAPTVGCVLRSAPPFDRPLLEIVEDTAPGHDLLHPACDPAEFATVGCAGSPSCREAHLRAAAAVGAEEAPDPLNLWFRSWEAGDGGLAWAPTSTAPGDRVVLRAVRACTVAANPCASELFGCSPWGPGAIRLGLVDSSGEARLERLAVPGVPPAAPPLALVPDDDDLAALETAARHAGVDTPTLARHLLLARAIGALGGTQPAAGAR